MGNVIMKAQQITYGASNVEKALDDLNAPELIELNKRMAAIDAWKANVHEETYTGSELTINNALALPARSLKTTINAIQDLHGLPFPYVGGAYKNKLPMTVASIKAANTLGTWSNNAYTLNGVTFTILTDSADNVTGIKANGTASAATYFTIYSSSNTGEYFQNKILSGCPTGGSGEKYSLLASDTVSVVLRDYGSGVTITNDTGVLRFQIQISSGYTANNVTFYPMVRLATETDPTFAPYSNLCPISGRDRVAVDDVGKNQWDASADDTVYGWGGTWSKSGQTYTCVASSSSIQLFSENGTAVQASHSISVEPNSNYCVSVSGMNISQVFGVMYDRNKQFLRFVRQQNIVNNSAVIAVPSDAYYMGLRIDNNSATSGKTYNFNIQIEEGSTATAYESYAHSSATIQLGQTVYGADINWDTGVGTVKTTKETFDGSSSAGWSYVSDYGSVSRFDCTNVVGKAGGNVISNYLKGGNDTSIIPNEEHVYLHGSYGYLIICVETSRLATKDVTGLMSYLASNPLQVEYELATPTTIQLTPEQLEMLKGYNRVTVASGYATIELKALILGGV